jgi:hypothetical protein
MPGVAALGMEQDDRRVSARPIEIVLAKTSGIVEVV